MSKASTSVLVDALLDAAVIVSVTILAYVGKLPGEAVVAILAGVAGARIGTAGSGPKGGDGPKPPGMGGGLGAIVAGVVSIAATRSLRG